jgi:hypothetical protein
MDVFAISSFILLKVLKKVDLPHPLGPMIAVIEFL